MTADAQILEKLDHLLEAFATMFESVLADDHAPPDDAARAKLRAWIERKRAIVGEGNQP